MAAFFEFLKAVLLGIVEGVTEWLPISSTGHMILVDEFITLSGSDAFKEMFFVVIQLGAIIAVPVLYFDRLNPFSRKKNEGERRGTLVLWLKVLVASVPAAILGLLLDDILDEYLYNPITVAIALAVYGIAFIVIERLRNRSGNKYRINDVSEITYRDAIIIGAYQTLSLIPGTSRSGSTILGGMLTGVSRSASAEFSFFLAIPVMLGASALKLMKFFMEGGVLTGSEIGLLLVASAVAFIVSVAVIKLLVSFVSKHSFAAFGIYRIVLGVAVIAYFALFA